MQVVIRPQVVLELRENELRMFLWIPFRMVKRRGERQEDKVKTTNANPGFDLYIPQSEV